MTQETLVGRDMRFRVTDKNGKTHIETRRVWDGARFAASFDAQHRVEGGRTEVLPPEAKE